MTDVTRRPALHAGLIPVLVAVLVSQLALCLLGGVASAKPSADVAFTIRDPAITEASALVPLPGSLFATTNDSGDTGRVFVLDGRGATVGVTRWEAHPTDVESLAPAPDGELWVGDTGGNVVRRSTVEVAKVPVGRGTRTVTPTIYRLTYPDGDHDAETLLCDPATGRLYVATKALLGGALYAAPAHLSATGPNRLTKVAPVLPIATDGAFLLGGHDVIIRNYLVATVYAWPTLRPKVTFLLPSQPQGEGIGFTARGLLYVSSEGRHSQVLRVPLPAVVRTLLVRHPSRPVAPRMLGGAVTSDPSFPWWPWLVGGLIALGFVGVLVWGSRQPRL